MSFSVTGDLQCRLSSTDRSFTVKVLTFDDNSCEKLISMETLAYVNVELSKMSKMSLSKMGMILGL